MAHDDAISGIDLPDDTYRTEQHLLRNKYRILDDRGNTVLRAKQKLFKMKEQFPFVDADGNEVFEIEAEGILDHSGDYTITDSRTGDPIAVLNKNFTLFAHEWDVKDPHDGSQLAHIESRGALVEALRSFVSLASLLPHKYTIEDASGQQIGEIEGQFSFRDVYDITVDRNVDPPREALVAAAIAIDALEGN
jgi:uncharacterized protein YxjI